ncbi:hypothetical protein [Nocardia arthritidis]|uniref:Uncharacterized protein n=1 Tax=Nocardia arthritidis TaxID=228602 RepID=A0A6G9YH45_9NOCA|nr:hypothetical protein [Nocardia arthritidis]QIS12511.1 hypothetical protein F5544_23260 [Nocardia arthritidis]
MGARQFRALAFGEGEFQCGEGGSEVGDAAVPEGLGADAGGGEFGLDGGRADECPARRRWAPR